MKVAHEFIEHPSYVFVWTIQTESTGIDTYLSRNGDLVHRRFEIRSVASNGKYIILPLLGDFIRCISL